MTDAFLQFLGIALRAGRLIAGEYPCLEAVRAGKGFLLVVAADASPRTADRLIRAARPKGLPFITAYTKEELGRALGQAQRAALLVTDNNIARRLQELAMRV